MLHLPNLIVDLALILGAAGITTLIFKKLKQPLVLGYIIAGILVGPHFTLVPSITDIENVKVWADIGVIFLLFSLGLEFSFKKLVKVGGSASISAIVEVAVMLVLGYVTGRFMGWSSMDSIFLGGILSISSTTIIIRAFDELGVKNQLFARLVFGILVVEDLVAILLLVLLSTLAISQKFAGGEMAMSVGKLSFFLVLWFLAGIFIIPTFLKRTKKLMSDETLLIVSLALCLSMVILATQVGFSPALGAFIMGSILAETTSAEKIEHLTMSVKDLFGAIFFVSVGMLIEPKMIVDYAGPIGIIIVVTIIGKTLSTATGALLSGQGLKQSLQAGMSLAQIGEFSFIIATLGMTLNVTSDFLYPIAVAVSALTTFTTPYMIRFAAPFYDWLESKMPVKLKRKLSRYTSGTQTINKESDWQAMLKSYVIHVVVLGVILIGIILVSSRYLAPFLFETMENIAAAKVLATGITLLAMTPFLWALTMRPINKSARNRIWLNKLQRAPLLALDFSRILIAVFLIGFLLDQFYTTATAIVVTLVLIVIIVILNKRLQKLYQGIEERFITNLNDREIQAAKRHRNITPWDAHLTSFIVPAESLVVGHTLSELELREKFGANVAMIERGSLIIMPPSRDERLFPGDKISVISTDDQLQGIQAYLESPIQQISPEQAKEDITLENFVIQDDSPLLGKTIRQSSVRETTQGLIVGIERRGNRLLNPPSDFIFQEGDIIWIVGRKQKIKQLIKPSNNPVTPG
ncbi:sodium:proton antiporter [Chitinophaga caeni]|uniref:Sodium:proton antiporter n=1 Tax=Chitinophaga caeni TaxID=2029983 RepID=A0A291QVE6_9BACT|nr:cation:proton antiporter [Chitinophaga caeni]ATL47843.1 sodium:proton antiporter [Chitinophaga caeni]